MALALQSTCRYSNIKPWQLRILELLPGQKDAPLEGNLISAALAIQFGRYCAVTNDTDSSHVVEYQALSYTWGSSTRTRAINLGSERLAVTENLCSALNEFRDVEQSTFWWIDAICIDQENLKERSEQVSNMLHIFQTAQRVRVWLGVPSEDSATAMDYLGTFDEIVTEVEDYDLALWNPLCKLYARPWLRRTWIRQEVYAAANITVHCGTSKISWKQFVTGFYLIDHIVEKNRGSLKQPVRDIPSVGRALVESTLSMSKSSKEPRELASILMFTPYFDATDERDAVFAVLGMCGIPSNELQPDYTKSIHSVWTEVSMYFIKHTVINREYPTRDWTDRKVYPTLPDMALGQHHIFNYKMCKLENDASTARSLDTSSHGTFPSWALDWRYQCDPLEIDDILRTDTRSYPQFGSMVPLASCQVPTCSPDNTLTVKGWIFGVIHELTDETCDLSAYIQKSGLSNFDPDIFRPYAEGHDTRRIARAYLQWTNCPVLVPASAKIGDVLVAIAPRVLPLVLSPTADSNVDMQRVLKVLTEDQATMEQGLSLHFIAEALYRCSPHYEFRGPAIGLFAVNVADVRAVDFVLR